MASLLYYFFTSAAWMEDWIKAIHDDIAIDNPAIGMFLHSGFTEEYRTDQIIMLRKSLIPGSQE